MVNRDDKEPTRSGFTLIELLVVIAVIAILAALILNTAGYVQNRAARSRASAEINAISASLESYKADYGDYPLGNGDDNPTKTVPPTINNALYTNLVPPSPAKVYFEFSSKMLSSVNNLTNIIDPFGNPYGYYYSTVGGSNTGAMNGVGFFDIWSTSGNATNTNLWIKNW